MATTLEDVFPIEEPTLARDQASALFQRSKICIAVDVSGSTYGRTLAAEIKAIKQVCSLIPQSMHDNITIIPWSDIAERARPLSQIHTLDSGGGTDPNVLLDDPECRLLLQEVGFWFLMTDGEIDDITIRRFARNLTDYGMHRKACIISLFGEKEMRPSDCNISVGLSVFAVGPHVAFLYTDFVTSQTSLLSTKGCFSDLLTANKKNPILDYDTAWTDLPLVSYENLTRVSIPDAQRVKRDDTILQWGTVINSQNLMTEDAMEERLMRYILRIDDNMKNVALIAKIDKLRKWLDKVDAKIQQDNQNEDTGNITSKLVEDTISRLAESDSHQITTQAQLSEREELSRRHAWMHQSIEANFDLSAQSLSTPFDDFILSSDEKAHGHSPSKEESGANQDGNLTLAVAGFSKPTQENDQFQGGCPRCKKPRAVLALLLRSPIQSTTTKSFPPLNSTSKLVYPLTMGNYPETDIIADALVCDSCAASLAKAGTTSQKEVITTALPLVSYSRNQDAWLQTLNIATGRRFYGSDLPQVFLGIIFTKIERLLSEPAKVSDLEKALHWEANMIQSEVILQAERLPNAGNFGAGLVHEVILRNFRDSLLLQDKAPLLLSYPIDGFIVANAALSNSKYSKVLTQEKRKVVVLLRFLYHILENHRAYGQDNGPVQLHAAKTLVLLMDDPSGPRSLFKWSSLRHFSFRFETLQEMRKYLGSNVVMNRYRLSLAVTDLLGTPLLTDTSLAGFRRLGPLFSWIESEAGHSIAVFIHYMMRLDLGACTPGVQFQKLRQRQEIKEALTDPGALSARTVGRLIEPLPVLE